MAASILTARGGWLPVLAVIPPSYPLSSPGRPGAHAPRDTQFGSCPGLSLKRPKQGVR